ncbi:dTDP-4-dehydrorhamnose 3,5-epimerase [bacterium]|nr:dTDP-4-dehydrorhamnose 3,5-epimerase [bacterium]
MKIIATEIPDVKLIIPNVFRDERGYFMESYRASAFADHGINTQFVQDNQSLSGKGILRGLHFQAPPFAQAKLVKVVSGAVLDVAVDIRRNSPTYGKHVKQVLSTENMHQLFIPEGFAHGFVTLEEHTVFQYKCSNYYHKDSEGGIAWNDADLAIDWEVTNPTLSAKDENATLFKDFVSPF